MIGTKQNKTKNLFDSNLNNKQNKKNKMTWIIDNNQIYFDKQTQTQQKHSKSNLKHHRWNQIDEITNPNRIELIKKKKQKKIK